MSLYDDLGISKEATFEDIKIAFKEKAKETHPDKESGSEEAFKRVNKAFQILSNERLRLEYDFSGKEDNASELQKDEMAQNLLAGKLINIINSFKGNTKYQDIVTRIKEDVDKDIDATVKGIVEVQNALKGVEDILRRLKFKRSKKNKNPFLITALNNEIRRIKFEILSAGDKLEILERAKEFIKNYSFEFEDRFKGGTLTANTQGDSFFIKWR